MVNYIGVLGGGISSFLPYNSTILQYFITTRDIYKRPLITPLGGTIFNLSHYFIRDSKIFLIKNILKKFIKFKIIFKKIIFLKQNGGRRSNL